MATIFGSCIDLTTATANVTGPGTWNAASGIFTATLPARGTCGGAGGADAAILHLVANGCGTLKFTVSGIGYKRSTLDASALVYTTGPVITNMQSPGGGSFTDYCTTGPLVAASGYPGTYLANCGAEIWLQLARTPNTNQGSINATFLVELIG